MTLNIESANAVILAAQDKARELDVRISVAVCDAGGRLLSFQRMDGAHWAGGYGAQGKAFTSAAFARPSQTLEAMADLHIFQGIAAAEGGHLIYCRGAVPIIIDGILVGAVGVGGGTGDQDVECATAGAAVLAP